MNPLLRSTYAYNVWLDVTMLPFLLLLALSLFTRYSSIAKANKCFRMWIVSIFIGTALEVISTLSLGGWGMSDFSFANSLLRSFYYAAVNISSYCAMLYICAYTGEKNDILSIVDRCLLYISFIMLVLNLMPRIGGFFFEISSVPGESMLIRGPYNTFCRSFYSLYFMLVAFYVHLIHREAYATRRLFILMNALWLMLLTSFIVQNFFLNHMLVTAFVTTLLVFIIFFCYEVPVYKQMAEAKKELDRSLILSEISARFAETATRAKADFLASMSHEIRTPINAILGMNEMLLKESRDNEVRRAALAIRLAGSNLLSIINNILDISKVESGKMELYNDDYHLWQLLMDVEDSVSETFHESGLTFKLDIDKSLPEHLYGDEDRMRQILINLVDNALKYTKKGSVTLIVRGEMEEDNYVKLKISVRDTGIGIRKEDLVHLFKVFERVNLDETQDVKGAGLGLTLVRYLLNIMGGRISVESEYGMGSTFSITLRQHLAQSGFIGSIKEYEDRSLNEALEGAIDDTPFTCPNAHILVVDDTPVNLVVARGMLDSTDALVDTAESGDECLELMSCTHYDIVFIDHLMPIMDGIETLDKAKKLPGGMDVVYIALTANAGAGLREEYMNYGFNDYIPKPLKFDAIRRVLALYLPKELKQKV